MSPLHLISDLNLSTVICAKPTDTIVTLTKLMAAHQVDFVAIARTCLEAREAPEGKAPEDVGLIPIGIITAQDIVRFLAAELDLQQTQAHRVMSAPVLSVCSDTTILKARALMIEKQIDRLLVTDAQGRLEGSVMQASLCEAIDPLELQQQREFLRTIIDTTPNMIFVKDLDGRFLLANQAIADSYGMKIDELTGKNMSDLYADPAIVEAFKNQNRSVIERNRELFIPEEKHCSSNLGEQWVQWQKRPIPLLGQSTPAVLGIGVDITQRRQIEIALRKSESKQRALISALPDLIMRMSKDGTYLDFFPTETFRIFGSFDLVGKNIYEEGLPFEIAKMRMGYIHQALQTKEIQIYEQELLVDNRQQIEEVRIAVCGEDEVLVVVRDITDRKLTEMALIEREEEFRGIFDQAAVGICYGFPNGQLVAFNRKCCEIFGFTPEELQSANFFNLSHPEDADLDLELSQRLFSGKILSYAIEKRFRHKSGSYRWFDLTLTAICDASGAIKYMLGVLIDIHDRKQAEETLQRLVEGAATITGENFLILVEYIATFLEVRYVVVSKNVNENSLETIVFWADGQIQPNISIILKNPPCGTAMTDGTFVCSSSAQQRFVGNAVMEFLKVESYMGIAMTNTRGEVIGNLCILDDKPLVQQKRANDILSVFAARIGAELERQEAIEALYQLNQELESRVERRTQELNDTNKKLIETNHDLARATRLKDQFLANMSHELRTPLNAILGMSEGILDEVFGSINDRQSKAITMIETSGKHLLALINDILDISKIGAGKLELEISTVEIEHLCQSSLSFVRPIAIKKNIQLDTAIQSDLRAIGADERRMRQVLINLLSNAVKFTPSGGQVILEVQLENRKSLNTSSKDSTNHKDASDAITQFPFLLRFSVIDTGVGISPENIENLFQNFFQVDSSLNRQYEGTGLGLTLVKQITELHGGKVTVQSQLGKGSCFSVWLPYAGTDSQKSGQEATETNSSKSSSESPLILLVADRQGNHETLSNYLSSRGYQLIFAETGMEALAIAIEQIPELILLDIQSSEQIGIAVTQEIRRNSHLSQIPIVALLGLDIPDEREKYLEAGTNQFLVKPIKLKQLTTAIEQLLTNK